MRTSIITMLLLAGFAVQAQEPLPNDAAADRAELIAQASPERTKALKKKTKKALKFVHAQDRYMEHRVVTIKTDILQRLDPVPPKPKDDSADVALVFEMNFTPTESEPYVLKNEKNFQTALMGKEMIIWSGTIANQDGEKIGEYSISDMQGKFDFTGFGFSEGDFGWGIRSIDGETETTLVKMRKPK
ncbi:MAG: hypothetical protein AB8G17_21090 [Gammaproteobacteria bacterium]